MFTCHLLFCVESVHCRFLFTELCNKAEGIKYHSLFYIVSLTVTLVTFY